MSGPDRLFSSGDLRAGLAANERKLTEAADAIPPDHALARSADELAAELFEKWRVEPLGVAWEAKTASIDDARIDVAEAGIAGSTATTVLWRGRFRRARFDEAATMVTCHGRASWRARPRFSFVARF